MATGTWLDTNPAAQLAVWFVQNYLGKPFDSRIHAKHIKDAVTLIKPYFDPVTGINHEGMSTEEVQEALSSYEDDNGRQPSSLLAALEYRQQLAVYDTLDLAFAEGRLGL